MYEKLKDENYDNLGGINVKASEYITGNTQFLDLRNYCFERPGALQSRHGITDHLTLPLDTFGTTLKSLFQWNSPNYLWDSPTIAPASQSASFYVYDSDDKVFLNNGATYFQIGSSLNNGYPYTFESEATSELTGRTQDYLYFANGENFRVWSYSLSANRWEFSESLDVRFPVTPSISAFGWTSGIGGTLVGFVPSGTHAVKVYLGKKFVGDITQTQYWYYSGESETAYFNLGATLPNTAGIGFFVDFALPMGFGYTAATVAYKGPLDNGFAVANVRTGNEFERPIKGFGFGSGTMSVLFKQFTTSYGITTIFDPSITPKYLTNYKNMLFQAGYSGAPSRVRHSELGNFLFTREEYFLEPKPGEGDEITGMIVYQNTLVVFKNNSIYEINGDSPDTLAIKTITEEYGCVNHQAAVTFNNKLWFVDKRGICEYNGPETFYVHYPVEDQFKELDVTKFRALHQKSDNQVWFFSDNVGLVYDYDVGAWTIYDQIPINNSSGSYIHQVGESLPTATWYQAGESFAFLSQLDRSVTTDRGQDITLTNKTRYHKRLGDSTTELWRRVFFNADSVTTGITVTINALPDYGDTVGATRFTNLGQFQSRVEMGVPGKSCALEFIIQAGHRVTFNGYTIESRYLRNV